MIFQNGIYEVFCRIKILSVAGFATPSLTFCKLLRSSNVERYICVGWVNSFIVNPTHRSTKCWVVKSATQPTGFFRRVFTFDFFD
jgi:hypothetical protein